MLRPASLLVGLVAVFLGLLLSRDASEKGANPAFSLKNEKKAYVELTFDDYSGGVYQINDGMTLCDVINLTGRALEKNSPSCRIPLVTGQRFVLCEKAQRIDVIEQGWMNAGKRIALSIPLHPDRMKRSDWLSLPGIGVKLAQKIEEDRQNNGDFFALKHLARVKGIGQKRLASWRKFFYAM